ncbi:hypothetical protein CDG81_02975 [Actinopolyspora erythraea]|uniref:Peptidase inhibitor family I36 protein n=1 Tax=Actinopolyspora erythraea TaxID=414996 RepID=A0A223RNH6_9ACTN|nr:peptidase inhibitor family I36 protein [Actinopolyspora erythraea]ASU77440.1 hypothetical protein CDG81_02975 [Actinopolyspora erythraea]
MRVSSRGRYSHDDSAPSPLRDPLPRRPVRALLPVLAALLLGAVTHPSPAGAATDTPQPCDLGVFCAWPTVDYGGERRSMDLRSTNMEECVRLGGDVEARSFVNRMDRPVTVYQDAGCATTADFSTYPSGSFVPRAPYVVRAVKVWTH